jgi:UDP-glucose-4-epimerase GalE
VIHFAAYAYVGESTVEPAKYYDNNVGGTAKLLSACVEFGCKNIVFSSSCATYGVPTHLPLREDHVQQPINPYGFTKLVAERMLKEVDAAHGITHVCLRYFNAAGADPDGEIGEVHEPETHLIPCVLLAAMGQHPSIKIFGNDYSTRDGTCIRDYIHVGDLASAHIAALKWLEAGNVSNSFNLGNGLGYSVAEVVSAGESVTGLSINAEIFPRRIGDPPALISDSTRARNLLNWEPQFPSLEQQMAHAWNWLRTARAKLYTDSSLPEKH